MWSILRHAVPVILEHALLPVKPGEEADFESAFAEAKAIIAAMPGFLRLTLFALSGAPEYPAATHVRTPRACLVSHDSQSRMHARTTPPR